MNTAQSSALDSGVPAHTPGPWTVKRDGLCVSIDKGDYSSIECYAGTQANARLIAAAPELLEALLYYRDECSGAEPSISVFHQKLDAAIARATARNPSDSAHD